MIKYKIKPISTHDSIKQLCKDNSLYEKSYNGSLMKATIYDQYNGGTFVKGYYAEDLDGNVIGVACSMSFCQYNQLIISTYVKPEYRDNGIGSKILSKFLDSTDNSNLCYISNKDYYEKFPKLMNYYKQNQLV